MSHHRKKQHEKRKYTNTKLNDCSEELWVLMMEACSVLFGHKKNFFLNLAHLKKTSKGSDIK